MKTYKHSTLLGLTIVQERLLNIGIKSKVYTFRKDTDNEVQELIIEGDDMAIAVSRLLDVRKAINDIDEDLHVEVGYTNTNAVIEIKPRYAYMTGSERKTLGFV